MGTTIFLAILLLLAAAILIFGKPITFKRQASYGREPTTHRIRFRWLALLLIGVFLLVGFLSISATVGAKNIGIVTQFNRPIDSEGAGWVWKAPWQKVTDIDGAVQTNEYKGSGEDGTCIYVRIGDGSRSCVTTTIRWRIVPERAEIVFGDYRGKDGGEDPTEEFRKAVISTQFKAAAQAVLAPYNPIAELEVVDGSNAAAASELSFAPDYDQIAADLRAQMDNRLGDEPLAEIVDITVSYVSLADSTQKTIDDFIKEVGRTRNAAQAKSTATEQAAANETIQESLASNADGVIASRCIDALNVAIEQDYQLPAGFTCTGAGGSVVIPSAPAPKG